MTVFAETALKYAELGFSVIPVNAYKKPIIPFADKHLFMWDVKKHWVDNPYSNIALRCTNIFVVDIDVNDRVNGFDSIKHLTESEWWPKTLSQTTASGGKQYLFKKKKISYGKYEEMQQIIAWFPGVDIKANSNNYFVVPPSVTSKGQYVWDNDYPIADAPEELLKLLKPKEKIFTINFDIANGVSKSKTAELFEIVADGFGDQGGRNDTAMRFTASLLSRGVETDATFRLLYMANENTTKPLEEKELNQIFNSVMKMHGRVKDD